MGMECQGDRNSMTISTPTRRWRVSPTQIVLGVAWSIFILAIEILIAVMYFLNQTATKSFSHAGDTIVILTNVQRRQTLLLHIRTISLLDDPSIGFQRRWINSAPFSQHI